MKNVLFLLCNWLVVSFSVQGQSTESAKAQSVKELLDSKQYIFKAQSVTPSRGGFRQLTSEYDMRVFNDSLITHLPFFGRAYTAPINTTDGGFRFTSTDFNYKIKARKKRWDITIQPKDTRDIQQLLLSVSTTGRATLQILSTNREAISFNGSIGPRR